MFRNSYRRCSVKKGVLRNFAKFTGKHLWQGLMFNKIAALRLSKCLSLNVTHNRFHPTSFFLYSLKKLKTSSILIFSGGLEKDQWNEMGQHLLRKKCSCLELFWSAISHIRTEFGRSISPNSVRKWENADQNNSEYKHFSRSDLDCLKMLVPEVLLFFHDFSSKDIFHSSKGVCFFRKAQ